MMNSSGTAAAAISNPSGTPQRCGTDLTLTFQTLHGPNASMGHGPLGSADSLLGPGSYGLFVIVVREAGLVRSALEAMSSMMAHWTMAEGESYSPSGSMTNVFMLAAAHFALPPCAVRSSDFSWESRC